MYLLSKFLNQIPFRLLGIICLLFYIIITNSKTTFIEFTNLRAKTNSIPIDLRPSLFKILKEIENQQKRPLDKTKNGFSPNFVDIPHLDAHQKLENIKTKEIIEYPNPLLGADITGSLNINVWVLTLTGTGNMTDWKENLSPWGNYKDSILVVIVGSGITNIGSCSFYNCSRMKTVTIPSNVVEIRDSAFAYCYALINVTIEDPSNLKNLDFYAFNKCISLPSIIIPSKVTNIDVQAFYYCISLVTATIQLPSVLQKIANNAFTQCYNLTTFTIPASVIFIHDGALSRCTNLHTITVESGNTKYSSDDQGIVYNHDQSSTFRCGCGKTGPVTIPGHCKIIKEYSFQYCERITSLRFMDGVETIERHGFYECFQIQSVEIPSSIIAIGNNAFCYAALEELTIPSNITIPTIIGAYITYGCHNLKTVTIVNEVPKIGTYAFGECKQLSTFKYCGSIHPLYANLVFSGSDALKKIYVTKLYQNKTFYDKKIEVAQLDDTCEFIKERFTRELKDKNFGNGLWSIYLYLVILLNS